MTSIETLPPQNLRAEMSVIGSCLRDAKALDAAMDILDTPHFYRPAHQYIWRCLVALAKRGEPVDTVMVTKELQRATFLESAGDYDYVVQCYEATPSAANVEHYARLVVEAYVRREIVRLACELEAAARDEASDIDAAIADVTTRALDLQLRRDNERAMLHIRQLMDDFAAVVKVGPTRLSSRIPTGFESLDKVIGGYQTTDLHYWGGGPGSGKTTLSMQSAYRVASAKPEHLVAYFSMELGQAQFSRRIASFASRLDGKTLEYGPISRLNLELPSLLLDLQKVGTLPFYVAFGRLSTTQIQTRLKQLMARENRRVSVVFIDRLELLSDSDCASLEETKRIPILSPRVKGIATSLNVPVVCLVQLNRAGRTGDPTMESFRGSGSIEQDCQVGCILRTDKEKEQAVVDVVKQNDGATGPCETMKFEPRFPMFSDIARRPEW